MKVLVTGVNGQLGHDVALELMKRHHEVYTSGSSKNYSGSNSSVEKLSYYQMNIINEKEVEKLVSEIKPDGIIHCAAWTAVDDAEAPENYNKLYDINVNGTKYIAKAAQKVNAKILYTSTDYVFDGQGKKPWKAEELNFKPLNEYGKSKLKGELAVKEISNKYFIVRIAWVFGLNGSNFVKTMLNVGKKYDTVKVVNDQIGTPTYTLDLAVLLVDMIESNKYGTYHATNEGNYISWYEFTKEIYRIAGLKTKVLPVTTEEYGVSKANRPYNSRLDKSKLLEKGYSPLPDWKDATKRFITILNREEE